MQLKSNNENLAHHVIKSARVTEKTTHLSERHNCFVFEVANTANKLDIKRAVEETWSVRVLSVRTQSRVGKSRRHRGLVGTTQAKKIAIVKLHSDDRLSFY